MLNFDEKYFFPHPESDGHFPPDHPPCPPERPPCFTPAEEKELLIREMRETIDRLLKFEDRVSKKVEDILHHITSDNVIFKTHLSENQQLFIREVQDEVNSFEGNVEDSITLFKREIEEQYAALAEKCETDIQTSHEEFRQTIETRIEDYNKALADSFSGYTTTMNTNFATLESEIRNDYAKLNSQIKNSINTFRTEFTNTITTRLNGQDSKLNDAILYMKTNLTASMEGLVNELITEGVIDTITRDAYTELVGDIYGSAFPIETIETIKSAKIIDVIAITVADKVYDFKGATINNLNVETTGAVIKNAIIKNCSVLAGSRNCRFENVTFENATQCINFSVNTWAFTFNNCSFIGSGETIAMNAGANTNTTLVLNNCYFYKCKKLIYATGGFVASIVGGWADHASQIVHTTSGNCEITINGFDFELVTNVFKADSYTFSTIAVNGIIGSVEAVVDYTDGIVNLFYTATVSGEIKFFSDNCPPTHYCSVPSANECSYSFNGTMGEKQITVYIPPNATVCVINNCYVSKIVYDNASAEIYTRYGKYTNGSTLNAVTPVYVRNIAEQGNNVTVSISTYNKI